MSEFIQQKYIDIVTGNFEKLSKRHNIWNFRCPLCGDSSTNTNKKRGYIIKKSDSFFFFCHNCNVSLSFENFLKNIDVELYNQFRAELFQERIFLRSEPKKAPEIISTESSKHFLNFVPKNIKELSELPENHEAIQYLIGRAIQPEDFNKIKYTEKLSTVIEQFYQKDELIRFAKVPDNPGILFPLYSLDKKLIGYQFRNIRTTDKRYRFFNIIFPGQAKAFFNILDIEQTKPIFVVEGCTDALMIPNTLAVIGSKLSGYQHEQAIYIPDQEPFNSQVVKEIKYLISIGSKVVLLPKEFRGKDLADLGKIYDKETLKKLILNNMYSGLRATIKLSKW